MNLNEVREAVRVVKGTSMANDFWEKALPTLISLAEDVISIAGKMPEKKEYSLDTSEYCNHCGKYLEEGITQFNQAIDECILAQAGKEAMK